jgi:hypothetical protein
MQRDSGGRTYARKGHVGTCLSGRRQTLATLTRLANVMDTPYVRSRNTIVISTRLPKYMLSVNAWCSD